MIPRLPACGFCLAFACSSKPAVEADPEPDTVVAPSEWTCPGSVQPVELGIVDDARVTEASGLAPWNDGLWVHNDSGDTARLIALTPAGAVGRIVDLGVTATDFEDAATRGSEVLVGDIGDNLARRSTVAIHRAQIDADTVATTTLTYPDGVARDAEALFVDPIDDTVYLISKAFSGQSEVFRAPVEAEEEVWEAAGLLQVDRLGGDRLVTAADMHPSGQWLAVRTYTRIHIFQRGDDGLDSMWSTTPCSIPWERESQGETISWWGDDLVTLSEGSGQTLWQLPIGVF